MNWSVCFCICVDAVGHGFVGLES
ncbi:hypothetical protein, partial [Kingella kingae]